MDRNPDEKGLQSWMTAMNDGMTREIVFDHFAESKEFQTICESYGLVDGSSPTVLPTPVPKPAETTPPAPDPNPPQIPSSGSVNQWQPKIVSAVFKNNSSIQLLNREQITANLTDVKFSEQPGAELTITIENKSTRGVMIDFNAAVNGQQSLISWWYAADNKADMIRYVPAGESRTLKPNVATRNTSYQGDFDFPEMKTLELMVNVYSANGAYAYESPLFCSDLTRISMSGTGNSGNVVPTEEKTIFNQNGINLSDITLESSREYLFLGAYVQNKGTYLTRIIVTGVKDESGKELGNYLGEKQIYALYNLFPNTGAYTRLALLNTSAVSGKIQLDFQIEYLNPVTGEKMDGGSYSTQFQLIK